MKVKCTVNSVQFTVDKLEQEGEIKIQNAKIKNQNSK